MLAPQAQTQSPPSEPGGTPKLGQLAQFLLNTPHLAGRRVPAQGEQGLRKGGSPPCAHPCRVCSWRGAGGAGMGACRGGQLPCCHPCIPPAASLRRAGERAASSGLVFIPSSQGLPSRQARGYSRLLPPSSDPHVSLKRNIYIPSIKIPSL